MMKKFFLFLVVFSNLLFIFGCTNGPYSFTGGNTGNAKTVSIANFPNESGSGPANLSQVFTEKLKLYIQQNSKLELVNSNGDWLIDGRITGYNVSSTAPQEDETSGLNRLTITVAVKFENTLYDPEDKESEEPKGFQSPFSFYGNFPQDQSLQQVEGQLVNEILDQVVFDIFQRTTSNW